MCNEYFRGKYEKEIIVFFFRMLVDILLIKQS